MSGQQRKINISLQTASSFTIKNQTYVWYYTFKTFIAYHLQTTRSTSTGLLSWNEKEVACWYLHICWDKHHMVGTQINQQSIYSQMGRFNHFKFITSSSNNPNNGFIRQPGRAPAWAWHHQVNSFSTSLWHHKDIYMPVRVLWKEDNIPYHILPSFSIF
jgi:hypothetical protein